MRKVYRKLTKEQKERNVIFSSQLVPSDIIHEVFASDENKNEKMALLKDDKFFNNSPFKHNLIRE